MLLGEGKILGLPELCFDNVVAMLFSELIVGYSALKQAMGILIQRAIHSVSKGSSDILRANISTLHKQGILILRRQIPQFYLTLCEPLGNLPTNKPSRGMSY